MPGAQDALRKAKRTGTPPAVDAEQFIKGAAVDAQAATEAVVPPWETVEEAYSERGKAKRVSFPLRLSRRDNAMLDWVAQELEISKNQVIRQLFLRKTLPEMARELWGKKMSS
jgi:hypothetical protein